MINNCAHAISDIAVYPNAHILHILSQHGRILFNTTSCQSRGSGWPYGYEWAIRYEYKPDGHIIMVNDRITILLPSLYDPEFFDVLSHEINEQNDIGYTI